MTQDAALHARPAGASPARPTEELRVQLIDHLELCRADAMALTELIAQRPQTGVFISRAWLSGFFKEPPRGVVPHLAIIREGERLRGIVPLGIRCMAGHATITLLGGGAGSDRADVLAARGFETACTDALLRWLRRSYGSGGFTLRLRDVPDDSSLWSAIHRLASADQMALAPRDIHAGPYLNLREWRTLTTAGLSSAVALSESLQRHRRWLERRGRVRIDILRDPADALAAFGMLCRFLHCRWRDAGGVSCVDNPWRQRFHEHAIPLMLADGYLRMVRISVDLRTVAVVYAIAAGDWWGVYLVGYDRAWAKRIHLGRLALACTMDLAVQEGASEFDFLKGAEHVKYQWPVRERSTLDADVYSGRARPQLARAVHASREIAVALGNAARHLVSRATVNAWTSR